MLGSLGGPRIKQQIGFSHLVFNLTTGIIAILILPLLISGLKLVYPVNDDPVIGLALFHTVFNLIGVLSFAPFLKPFAHFIEKTLPQEEKKDFKILQTITSEIPEAGLVSLHEFYEAFILQVFDFNLKVVKIDSQLILNKKPVFIKEPKPKTTAKYYSEIKAIQNEIITFSASISKQALTDEEAGRLNKLIHSLRFAAASAKSMKDTTEYLEAAAEAEHPFLDVHVNTIRRFIMTLYQELTIILDDIDETKLVNLINWRQKVINTDRKWMSNITTAISTEQLTQDEIDTLLSLNRSIILSCRQIISSLRDAILSEKEIEIFEET